MMRAHPALKRMGSVMMWAGAAMIIGSAPESEQQGTRYASPAQTKSPFRGFFIYLFHNINLPFRSLIMLLDFALRHLQ